MSCYCSTIRLALSIETICIGWLRFSGERSASRMVGEGVVFIRGCYFQGVGPMLLEGSS